MLIVKHTLRLKQKNYIFKYEIYAKIVENHRVFNNYIKSH